MKDTKWKLLKSTPVFESKWLSVLENDYELPDGQIGKGYYHVSRPNYILIIVIDSNEQILVERMYRRGVDDFVYEIPAGWIEEGETPKQAAERELKEETGYVGEGEVLGELYPQPGFSSMKAFVTFVRIDQSQRGESKLEKDEYITHEFIALKKIKEMIQRGEIKDMGFLAALQMAGSRI